MRLKFLLVAVFLAIGGQAEAAYVTAADVTVQIAAVRDSNGVDLGSVPDSLWIAGYVIPTYEDQFSTGGAVSFSQAGGVENAVDPFDLQIGEGLTLFTQADGDASSGGESWSAAEVLGLLTFDYFGSSSVEVDLSVSWNGTALGNSSSYIEAGDLTGPFLTQDITSPNSGSNVYTVNVNGPYQEVYMLAQSEGSESHQVPAPGAFETLLGLFATNGLFFRRRFLRLLLS